MDLTRRDDVKQALHEGLMPTAANSSLGSLGCAAAHFRAMRRASFAMALAHDSHDKSKLERFLRADRTAARGPKALALVLEDDVWLTDGFVSKLRELIHHEAPCDWQVLSLKSRCPFGKCVSSHLSRVRPDGNGGRCSGLNLGFFAMLYRVETLDDVWKKLYRAVWSQSCHDIDVALAGISDKVAYYAVPAIQMPGLLHEASFDSLREARDSQAFPSST